jgi:lysophospholipase L1-like esterase
MSFARLRFGGVLCRAALLLLIASLSACGGSDSPRYTVSGTVVGLDAGLSLSMSNNGSESLTVLSNGKFSFLSTIPQNGSYTVSVAAQPIGQTCVVNNATGSGISSNIDNVSVTCTKAAPTAASVAARFQLGLLTKAVMIGNSIGCGYYATGWEFLVAEPNSKLTEASRKDARVRSAAIMLREKLMQANAGSDLINLSGSGWDTNDHAGTGRFPGADTIGDAIRLMPDVVFLPLQVNDFLLQRGTFAAFQANTRAMVQRLLDAKILPVLVKENYILENADGVRFQRFIDEVDLIARERGIPVIDSYTPFRDAIQSTSTSVNKNLYNDNVHPNGAGHALIFKQYSDFFDSKR